jgi:hypothetical protein
VRGSKLATHAVKKGGFATIKLTKIKLSKKKSEHQRKKYMENRRNANMIRLRDIAKYVILNMKNRILKRVRERGHIEKPTWKRSEPGRKYIETITRKKSKPKGKPTRKLRWGGCGRCGADILERIRASSSSRSAVGGQDPLRKQNTLTNMLTIFCGWLSTREDIL